MKKKKNFVWNIFFALVFLAGAGVFLYPTVSDMWNQYRNVRLVSRYDEAVTDLSDNEYEKLWNEAKEYNAEHPVNSIVDAFGEKDDYVLTQPYDQVLDPNGEGLMGSIEIPKINAKLAIYHGLSKTVLEKGVGHVEGTSLPVGGKSTHAVLAAHRGLPSAKLFTDLDQMKKGDIFILHILGKNLAYKVDQIRTVLPEETGELDIVEGEDHVTLVTCTPYGVNTHRLLVRGIRTKYAEGEIRNDETISHRLAVTDPRKVLAGGFAVLIVLILLIYLSVRYRDKKRRLRQLSERKDEAESDEK
ncbi:class C sortase [Blautia schinkii]|uniref:class C sortase n=1 Tax=Blautia schinkii TaxID=180164 RepID=UPI00156F7F7D|nr:class C sortase [Blautia schinkii]NSG82666.1 class C sortase [Blautia schinkii]NSK23269.1 class C sortase [Blautia schinkii]NSK26309.1 class C sortase [Blautia schinkii]NSK32348.1 class C sortase [Blautia schinkii]NSK35737.1 class C sortase [Blautia schinkii]